jgi:hypothetical protein
MRKLGKGVLMLTHYVRQAGPKMRALAPKTQQQPRITRGRNAENDAAVAQGRDEVKCSIIASQTQNLRCESIRQRVCIHLLRNMSTTREASSGW